MMVRMMKLWLWLLLLGLTAASAAAGPGSCVGRCGEVFTRGQQCTCDFSCLQHSECCPDFEATCTNAHSCQGRCSEPFRRGQLCECDPQCIYHSTCCYDYQLHCNATVPVSQPATLQPLRASGNWKPEKIKTESNSESEERFKASSPQATRLQGTDQPSGVFPLADVGLERPRSASGGCRHAPGGQCQVPFSPQHPWTADSSGSGSPVAPARQQHGPVPLSIPYSYVEYQDSPAPAVALPTNGGPSQGSRAPVGPTGHGGVGSTVTGHLLVSPEGLTPYGSSQDLAGSMFQAQTQEDRYPVAQSLSVPVVDARSEGPGAGLFADVHLCSDSPFNGLTALTNGTILVFKGELFWSVDPVTHLSGPPQSITDTLGVPSPIDTVFTRWTCYRNTNTYIIRGDQCWRLSGSMVVDPGYPKPLASEFPGLTGSISAALAVPATRSRPETVYFFRNGDIMQSFTFPSCSTKPRSSVMRHLTHQAGLLSGEINIKLSLKRFPTPITSALTMPSPQRGDRFYHYVFSGPLFFRVQIAGDRPALAKPDPSAPLAPLPMFSPATTVASTANMAAQSTTPISPANSIRVWLYCP